MNYEGSVQKQKTNSFVKYFDVLIHTIISDNREKEREGRLIKAREESRERENNERLQSRNPVKGGPPPTPPTSRCPFDGKLDSIELCGRTRHSLR